MTVTAKICGLTTPDSIRTAIEAGASHIGFVFFDKSPRNVIPEMATKLAAAVPSHIVKTGVFVNPSDELLDHTVLQIPLDLVQLHGSEPVRRVQEVKDRYHRPVMKAISISTAEDLEKAHEYDQVADMILFDAKAPEDLKDALPGGNGLQFDWQYIKNWNGKAPWMLSGGLSPENIQEAITISGAKIVDVSSGVETSPGVKCPARIKAFLKAVNKESLHE